MWCDACQGTGTVDCRCGGDLCICENYGEEDCPKCGGVCDIDDDRDDYDDSPADKDAPLNEPGCLASLGEPQLQREWERQCTIHDNGVDHLAMGHPTIEDADRRLRLVEAEQVRRGFEKGPSSNYFGE